MNGLVVRGVNGGAVAYLEPGAQGLTQIDCRDAIKVRPPDCQVCTGSIPLIRIRDCRELYHRDVFDQVVGLIGSL
jgi:hypothetical protein